MNKQLEEAASVYRQRLNGRALANAGRVNHGLTDGFTYGQLDARAARKKVQTAIVDLDRVARAATLSDEPNRLELLAEDLRNSTRWTQHKALQALLDEAELDRNIV